MGAAPAPPAAALQRGVRAVAATPRAGVARRGGGGARGRGLGVLALCAASELLHEHPPLVHAVVVRAQLERLASVVEGLLLGDRLGVLDHAVRSGVNAGTSGPLSLLQLLETHAGWLARRAASGALETALARSAGWVSIARRTTVLYRAWAVARPAYGRARTTAATTPPAC